MNASKHDILKAEIERYTRLIKDAEFTNFKDAQEVYGDLLEVTEDLANAEGLHKCDSCERWTPSSELFCDTCEALAEGERKDRDQESAWLNRNR